MCFCRLRSTPTSQDSVQTAECYSRACKKIEVETISARERCPDGTSTAQPSPRAPKHCNRSQIAKCRIAGFDAEIAEKSPENRSNFFGVRNKNRSVSAFSSHSTFGILSLYNFCKMTPKKSGQICPDFKEFSSILLLPRKASKGAVCYPYQKHVGTRLV